MFGIAVDPEELAMVEYQFRCERNGALVFETPVLSAGEAFTHAFYDEGVYEVFDVDAPESRGFVDVVAE